MQAEIKTLLPSSLMVKISLTDSTQITLLSLALYVTADKKIAHVNILHHDRSVLAIL